MNNATCDAVIFWGSSPDTEYTIPSSSLEGKIIIVIDPICTRIAQSADVYIQIKARCDLHLALLLSRFAIIEGIYDSEYLVEWAPDYKNFYELTQTVRIKSTLESIGVTLGEMGLVLETIQNKKATIFVGNWIEKQIYGEEVLRTIEAFGVITGLFAQSKCGVYYQGDMRFKTGKFEFIDEIDLKID